jgi:hypothetical protein
VVREALRRYRDSEAERWKPLDARELSGLLSEVKVTKGCRIDCRIVGGEILLQVRRRRAGA